MIVHRSGWVDLETVPAFWTEVPAHTACASEGRTMDEVVERTREALTRWTGRVARVTTLFAG